MRYCIGSYTEANAAISSQAGAGISQMIYDAASDALISCAEPVKLANPSYLLYAPHAKVLYAANELAKSELCVLDSSFDVAAVLPLNAADACHLTLNADETRLFIACYTSGDVIMADVSNPFSPKVLDTVSLSGKGPHPTRQTTAHAHSTLIAPDGSLLVADLGSDRIWRFLINKNCLLPHPTLAFISMPAGSGPRHMALHPNQRFLYISLELSNGVAVLNHAGQLIQTIACEKAGFPSEIQISSDGKMLYMSNRGADEIVYFHVCEKTGQIKPAGNCSSGGRFPRHFHIDEKHRRLFAANQLSGNLAILALDAAGFPVEPPLAISEMPSAVCIAAVNLD